jgi:O-acetyl-ADP-ribose deacetylase (regulator of RNase III)
VNTTGTDLKLVAGTISYTILETGGKAIQEELTQACPSGLKVGGVAQTKGGNLNCQKIFHVVLQQWFNVNCAAETVRTIYLLYEEVCRL